MTLISHKSADDHLLAVLPHPVHPTYHFALPRTTFFAIREARALVPCPDTLHVILVGTASSLCITIESNRTTHSFAIIDRFTYIVQSTYCCCSMMDHEFTARCDIRTEHHFTQIDSIFLCLIVDSLMPPKRKQSSQTATNSQFTVEDNAVSSQAKRQRAVQPFDSEPSPPAGESHENLTRLLHDTLTSFCNRYRTRWTNEALFARRER